MPTPRASCSPSTSRAPTSSSPAWSSSAPCSQRALAQREEMLTLTRQRVSAGLDTAVELRQSEGALPETRQQIEALEEQIALTRHALAALVAEPPQRFEALAPSLSTLHPIAHARRCVPADLLGRRADIVAARWRVEAADQRRRGAARAVLSEHQPGRRSSGLSSLGLDRLLAREQPAVGRRPGDPPADLRRRPAARQPARQDRRPRRRGRDLQRRSSSTRSTTSPTDQLATIGRAPAARAGARRRSRPRRPTTWRRSAIAPASAATSPC